MDRVYFNNTIVSSQWKIDYFGRGIFLTQHPEMIRHPQFFHSKFTKRTCVATYSIMIYPIDK
jgi:hypothetical protein